MFFSDMLQKVIVDLGIASDRVNKVLEKLLADTYIQGFKDCADFLEKEIDIEKIECFVRKNKETFR